MKDLIFDSEYTPNPGSIGELMWQLTHKDPIFATTQVARPHG